MDVKGIIDRQTERHRNMRLDFNVPGLLSGIALGYGLDDRGFVSR
jgi:hypothetical protein